MRKRTGIRAWLGRRLGVLSLVGALAAAAAGTGMACQADSTPAPRGSVTKVPEAGDVIDQELMIALAQAKNFHHKAKVYMSDGNLVAATASVRQILSLRVPPRRRPRTCGSTRARCSRSCSSARASWRRR
jgi:hypothetical protein